MYWQRRHVTKSGQLPNRCGQLPRFGHVMNSPCPTRLRATVGGDTADRMLQLDCVVDPRMPRLAWAIGVSARDRLVRAIVGASVEKGPDFLVEGAWSGAYGGSGFASAATFSGTGLTVKRDGLVISTPTHTLSPVYCYRTGKTFYASNSLPLLLKSVGDSLDPHYPHYDADIMSVVLGIHRHRRSIPTRRKNLVHIRYACNLSLDDDLNETLVPKQDAPSLSSYENYAEFLQSEIRQLYENAHSDERQVRYGLLSTISTGYDSPACAVLARNIGCTQTITIDKAREDFAEESDSGAAIAQALGMNVVEVQADNLLANQRPLFEAEFLGAGYGGDDITLSAMEPYLADTLLFTGYHGDKIWDRNNKNVTSDLVRGDPSGCSLLEFRLRVGFINIPVPFIGAFSHHQIHAISRSPDLAPWTLNNRYDRPIPRRLVEAAGVPRQLFGQKKLAVSRPYQTMGPANPPLDTRLTPNSLQAFRDYVAEHAVGFKSGDHRLLNFVRRGVTSQKIRTVATSLGMGEVGDTLRLRYKKPQTEHNHVTAWASAALMSSSYSSVSATSLGP